MHTANKRHLLMDSNKHDAVVLNYHDSLLRLSDVRLLEEGQWLNDAIIGFAYEYFEHEVYAEHGQILFVNPDVVQLLKLCTEADSPSLLESLGLLEKQLVFLPVNDHGTADTAGGSHWTLLVWDRRHNSILHYDSALYGHPASQALQQQRLEFTGASAVVERLLACSHGEQRPTISAGRASRQSNGHDCGVYVIAHTEKLVELWLGNQPLDCSDLSPEFISLRRRRLKDTILGMQTELT